MSMETDNNGTDPATKSAPVVHSNYYVTIAEGGLIAYLRISQPSGGGSPPSYMRMRETLVKNGVLYNIDQELLKELETNPRYGEDIIVARGIEPINGVDGTATLLIQTENKGRPKEIENGRVDYFDLGLIENVTAGQALCKITLPTQGSSGKSVRGEVMRPKIGKPAPITPGPNTELNADQTAIIAKIDGQFEFDGKKVSVSETYTLNSDVDTSTGNIKVSGNLIIRGKVNSGFIVEAGGFINIVGVVDNATVNAGKDLNLQGGANGATITCNGNLKSRFIENCNVFVRGDIRVEYILNSNVRCKKTLKTEGVISKIIGGTCVVLQSIECRTIGSATGSNTRLEIGNDPELIDRQHALAEQIPELEKQMKSLEPLLKLLRQLEEVNRLDEEKKATLEKASFSYQKHQKMLDDAKRELAETNEALFQRNYGKVICTGIVYPGTVIAIGSASYTVTSNMMNTSFYYKDGDVTFGSAR
jgi:uncharacterized protein (DUF342 family)